MKLIALLAAAAIAVPATAVEYVSNGGFETVTQAPNFEFGVSANPGYQNAVVDWQSNTPNAYNLLFDPTTAFTPAGNANGQYQGTGQEYLATGTASPVGGYFVALDGDSNVAGPLTQAIAGLSAGQTYTLTFYWSAGQVASRTGATTEQLQVSFGGANVFNTSVVNVASQGTVPWMKETVTLTAGSGDGSNLLSFFSAGTPNGRPPIAFLDGVSITGGVPEASTWGMLIAGFGLVGVAARRRKVTAVAA